MMKEPLFVNITTKQTSEDVLELGYEFDEKDVAARQFTRQYALWLLFEWGYDEEVKNAVEENYIKVLDLLPDLGFKEEHCYICNAYLKAGNTGTCKNHGVCL